MTRAFVCPGQGAQSIGMGKALADTYPESKAVFQEVDEALGQHLSALIWEGDPETLTLTENAQPALMATSLAAFRALEREGVSIQHADYVAGHSLGEYSALALSGALSIADTACLLKARGKAMQAAVPVGVGAMAAILGLNLEIVNEVAAEAAGAEVCEAANDNDPGQVVVSGNRAAVERAVEIAKSKGAKRAIILPVSAPFHCKLMTPAAEVMKEALVEVSISAPKIPLVANVCAEGVSDPESIRKLLIEQITASVRWRESVLWMSGEGVSEVWEIGAGKALSGMVRRINGDILCHNVAQPEDISTIIQSL